MPTTSPATSPLGPELERLAESLCRAIARNRYDEARQAAEQCAALHTIETHHAIMSVLERARQLAIVQRTFAAEWLAILQSANRYAPGTSDWKHYIGKG